MTRHSLKALLIASAALPLASFAFVMPAMAQQDDEDSSAVETEAAGDAEEVWDDAGMVAGAEDADAWASENDAESGDAVQDDSGESDAEAAGGGGAASDEAPASEEEGAVEISANGGGSRNGTGGPDQ